MAIKKDLKKVTMNLPVNLVNEIDKYATQVGITRTMAVILLCSNQLADIKEGEYNE